MLEIIKFTLFIEWPLVVVILIKLNLHLYFPYLEFHPLAKKLGSNNRWWEDHEQNNVLCKIGTTRKLILTFGKRQIKKKDVVQNLRRPGHAEIKRIRLKECVIYLTYFREWITQPSQVGSPKDEKLIIATNYGVSGAPTSWWDIIDEVYYLEKLLFLFTENQAFEPKIDFISKFFTVFLRYPIRFCYKWEFLSSFVKEIFFMYY